MSDEISIKRQLQRNRNFQPPYCPNQNCKYHLPKQKIFFIRHGLIKIKRFPYATQRFLCKHCQKTFSSSFFELHYYQKVWGLNEAILTHHNTGLSKRESARQVGKSEYLVRQRLIKMARWSLLFHAKTSLYLKIEEPIVYDGLENFSFSQFDPNNINQCVGKKSLFIYDFNFAPLNRKGKMSERQKMKKKFLEQRVGTYPRDILKTTTKRVVKRLLTRCEHLTLYSDKHFQYKRALSEIRTPIRHITVSSKIARNFKNELFAVNNIDLMARHNLAAFKRETIAFSKHSIAMQESFLLYSAFRNYMRPKFYGTHRSDPESSKKSPAMELGLTKKIYTFKEFFKERVLKSHVQLPIDWEDLYHRIDPLSRRPILRFC